MKNYVFVILTGIVVSVSTTIGVDPEKELWEITSGHSSKSWEEYQEQFEQEPLEDLNFESVFGQLEEEIIYSIQQIEESEVRLD